MYCEKKKRKKEEKRKKQKKGSVHTKPTGWYLEKYRYLLIKHCSSVPFWGLSSQSQEHHQGVAWPRSTKRMTSDHKDGKVLTSQRRYHFGLFDLIDGDFESTSEVSKCDACHRAWLSRRNNYVCVPQKRNDAVAWNIPHSFPCVSMGNHTIRLAQYSSFLFFLSSGLRCNCRFSFFFLRSTCFFLSNRGIGRQSPPCASDSFMYWME